MVTYPCVVPFGKYQAAVAWVGMPYNNKIEGYLDAYKWCLKSKEKNDLRWITNNY